MGKSRSSPGGESRAKVLCKQLEVTTSSVHHVFCSGPVDLENINEAEQWSMTLWVHSPTLTFDMLEIVHGDLRECSTLNII